MPKIVLASGLARWLRDAGAAQSGETAIDATGASLGDALESAFTQYPQMRGYVVDDQGAVRHHVAVFVDGVAIADKVHLQVPVRQGTEIYIMQALSGG
ncbi:MAG TPA: MoaD/ThiS family protein [Rudaea sp.]|uniref:MoaD/ThiS family protein n=1 Tax=Rudaea sp. TaxID=2136325 RepID=UPI002F94A3C9